MGYLITWPFQKVHLKIFLKTDSSSENLCELFKLRCYSVGTFSAKPVWAIGSSRAKKLARCVRFVVSLQQDAGRCWYPGVNMQKMSKTTMVSHAQNDLQMVEAVVIVICNFVLEKKTVAELIVALQVFLGPSWLTKESSGLIVALQVFS